MAATAIEPPPPLGDISGLSATAGAAAGTIALSWTPGANATRRWIAGIKDADRSSLAVWMAADNMDSHTVTGLDGGAAYILSNIWPGLGGQRRKRVARVGALGHRYARLAPPAAFLFRWLRA